MGVLGATGACGWHLPEVFFFQYSYETARYADVSLRAIGKQAHALHSLVSFSTICVVAAPIGYFYDGTDNERIGD